MYYITITEQIAIKVQDIRKNVYKKKERNIFRYDDIGIKVTYEKNR